MCTLLLKQQKWLGMELEFSRDEIAKDITTCKTQLSVCPEARKCYCASEESEGTLPSSTSAGRASS